MAQIWFEGWHDGHAAICPAELTALRTLPSFLDRSASHLARTKVAILQEKVIGFYMMKGLEVYQFYVASAGRGTGVAMELMADAERQFYKGGAKFIWLACSIGNDRAARFYEKCGWTRNGTIIEQLEVSTGSYPLKVWRYEKELT
jgi:GNAT superfamily N-acetyltransferase